MAGNDGKEDMPYRRLGVFKIEPKPLQGRSLGVQRRFVASQIEPGPETPVLQVITQDDSPQRGYYPIFQPLDLPDFLPGSGIFVVTVVTDQSRRVEAQSDERTKSEILAVLRQMFGDENVPDPIDFMYPRWGQTPWARGSYSNWPTGLTLEGHQNLRANVDRLWFAGEATSQQYFGYLQAAYLEGKGAGERVATLLNGGIGEGDTRVEGEVQGDEVRYEVLKGTTTIEEYGPLNGWYVSSFQEGVDEEGGAT